MQEAQEAVVVLTTAAIGTRQEAVVVLVLTAAARGTRQEAVVQQEREQRLTGSSREKNDLLAAAAKILF